MPQAGGLGASKKTGLKGLLPSWMTRSLEDVYLEKYGGRYPGLAENIGAMAGSGLKTLGLPKHVAETTGRNIASLGEDWTGLGVLTAAEELPGAIEGGDIKDIVLTAAGTIPVIGGKAKKAKKAVAAVADALPSPKLAPAASPAPAQGLGAQTKPQPPLGAEAPTEVKAAAKMARPKGIAGHGTVGTVAPEPLSSGRISQRFPTGVDAEDPLRQNLLINTNVLKSEPDKLAQAAEIIRSYPGVTKKMLEMNPSELVDAFRDSISGNLTALYDLMPRAEAERAARWYHGAHRISQERAKEIGIHPYASAGMYAALSPQMDWFKNVYLGDQTGRILNLDPKLDAEMIRRAQHQPTLKGSYADKPERMEILRSLEGRSLGAMTPEEQALVLRLHDETYGPRQYNKITPEGDYGDLVTTKTGEPAKPGWGSFSDIQKSIESARSGGDPDKISPLMGYKHKVRNFYNDIVAPLEAEKFGDVTIDTHQIAGGLLRPLSGEDLHVAQGLGSKPPSSAATGLQGLYPIYADATRNAAARRNMPVIAMQSVPWEAVRSLFSKEFKTPANKAKVEKIWRDYGSGKISAPEARRRVVAVAGGFKPPTW